MYDQCHGNWDIFRFFITYLLKNGLDSQVSLQATLLSLPTKNH